MRKTLLFSFLTLCAITQTVFAQDKSTTPTRFTAHNKGKFYVYWGGNREDFTRSDIHFKGTDYDFTLYGIQAHDKPKGWHVDYVNPTRMTIPQTNFRLGYFINDHYNISFGFDHMKYVMEQNQVAHIGGVIGNSYPAYAGTYLDSGNHSIDLSDEKFLTFEHTNGLNYVNSEFCRVDDFSKIFKIRNTDKFQVNLTEGVGFGFLYPKTNVKLLEKERHDEFNVAGWGASAKVGLNLTFLKYFFVQGELKGGYIDMQNIKTSYDPSDHAAQHFLYLQRVIAFGGIFKI